MDELNVYKQLVPVTTLQRKFPLEKALKIIYLSKYQLVEENKHDFM